MVKGLAAYAVIPAVFVAGGLAFWGVDRLPAASTASHVSEPLAPAGPGLPSEMGALPPDHPAIGAGGMGDTLPANHPAIGAGGMGDTLPPDHPPIGSGASPHGSMPSSPQGAMPAGDSDPALTWKMPATWKEAPNPNAMRLATYQAPGGVQVSVSRAGGDNEANIQRWIGQFDNVGHDGRSDKTVHGLHVDIVDIAGTFVGGGMAMGAAAEPKPDWAMVGAIVETASPRYFFKMTGPAAAVRAARPAFDRLVDGVTPM